MVGREMGTIAQMLTNVYFIREFALLRIVLTPMAAITVQNVQTDSNMQTILASMLTNALQTMEIAILE